jgi:hypothetical protein
MTASLLLKRDASSSRFRLLFEHDLRANAFRVGREGKPLCTFPDHALLFDHVMTAERNAMAAIDPLTAGAVFVATAATDAVYVMFTSAVIARKRVPAASWSAIWYLLSSYAVISYTENAIYVAFAAAGSWVGAYASMTFLHRPPGGPPVGAAPE